MNAGRLTDRSDHASGTRGVARIAGPSRSIPGGKRNMTFVRYSEVPCFDRFTVGSGVLRTNRRPESCFIERSRREDPERCRILPMDQPDAWRYRVDVSHQPSLPGHQTEQPGAGQGFCHRAAPGPARTARVSNGKPSNKPMKALCAILSLSAGLAAGAQSPAPSQPVTATIDASKTGPPISPYTLRPVRRTRRQPHLWQSLVRDAR